MREEAELGDGSHLALCGSATSCDDKDSGRASARSRAPASAAFAHRPGTALAAGYLMGRGSSAVSYLHTMLWLLLCTFIMSYSRWKFSKSLAALPMMSAIRLARDIAYRTTQYLRPDPSPCLVWDVENPAEANKELFTKLKEMTTGTSARQVLHQFVLDAASIFINLMSLAFAQYFEQMLIMCGAADSATGSRIYTDSLTSLLYPVIRNAMERAASPVFDLTDMSLTRIELLHQRTIEASKPILGHLSAKECEVIKRIDSMVEDSIRALKRGTVPTNDYKSIPDLHNLLEYKFVVRLGQPRSCQNYFETCDLELRAATLKRIPTNMRLPIQAIINQMIATSIRGLDNKRRCQTLLLGSPGVGKSSLVKHIARLLGANSLCYMQDDLEMQDVSGKAHWMPRPRQLPGEPSNLAVQGAEG